ncbi:hypothetical protein PtA15_3A916 [Puccinia triticina]|uniref:Uncharacterized protein n=1 Tax=Puccinia triticina TaxID=208348 RepID=A0ABY7CEL8_9BASI|nr:uncharacterized protein PtA15_3A916 [Puccinia triticina]WAQ83545.1 hypothetical protein PtA15_3A916 [Puccinia triticina]
MNAQLKDSAATRARPPPFNPFAHRTPAVPNGELPDDGLDPTPMTPADQIYAHFGVVPLSANLATHFKLMPQAQQNSMLFSMLGAILQRNNPGAPPAGEAAPPIVLSQADQVRIFEYLPAVKVSQPPAPCSPMHLPPALTSTILPRTQEVMQEAARDAMMISNVKAYTRDTQERSLFRMVMNSLRQRPAQYQRTHFPPQFLAHKRAALNHVQTEVRRQIKNVRYMVRNHALTGVVLGHGHTVLPAIPTLDDYARELWRFLMGTTTRLTDSQVDTTLAHNPQLKARFTYIRLATMSNHFDPAARTILHWDQIDAQLNANRPRSKDYVNAWTVLVVEKDHKMFGSSPLVDEVNKLSCRCPTDAEVTAQVALMA